MKKITLIAIVFFLAACGNKPNTKTKELVLTNLGLKMTVLDDWENSPEEENEYAKNNYRVEITKGQKKTRNMVINEQTSTMGTSNKLTPSVYFQVADNDAAKKGWKIITKDSTSNPNGVGIIYEKEGKKHYQYLFLINNRWYEITENEFYYNPDDVSACIDIIKTIKAIK